MTGRSAVRSAAVALVLACTWASVALARTDPGPSGGRGATAEASAVRAQLARKIRHVVVVMQENRSFDHYFGTYPGADGIAMRDGVARVCLPDPLAGTCRRPYHDRNDINRGGAHGSRAHLYSVNGGRMNGFIRSAEDSAGTLMPDVVGYHDAREIANYWRYAQEYVLQDRLFGPVASWSFPAHMYMVSAWSARCTIATNPLSCRSSLNPEQGAPAAWTDITHLLHRRRVTWGYYVFAGREPDCVSNEELDCAARAQSSRTPSYWNPLPLFTTVRENGQLGNVQPVRRFFQAIRRRQLPAVSWVIPSWHVSEHPLARVSSGQAWVTSVVNAIMRSPHWKDTAIFVSWDDWGGYYDHVRPPVIDGNGYGLRVPGLVISPYARRGVVDHQQLSHDAYLKFIEDVFLDGQRLDPATDGRPDRRPTVREAIPELGDLARDFDFTQPPRRPLILRTRPRAGRGPGPLRARLRVARVHRDARARPRLAYRLFCDAPCSPRATVRADRAPVRAGAAPAQDVVLRPGWTRLEARLPRRALAGLGRRERRRVRLRVVVRAQAGWSRTLERRVVLAG